MTAHYSKFDLNTYAVTPYFRAHIPENYPLHRTLQACRMYRRLPPRLRKLAKLAKRWAIKHWGPEGIKGISRYYNKKGLELEPSTGRVLSDQEIDKAWGARDPKLKKIKDIPAPKGGFADPDTWEEPQVPDDPLEEELVDFSGMTQFDMLQHIKSRGAQATIDCFGVPAEMVQQAKTDDELAALIMTMHGKPHPARWNRKDAV